MPGDPFRIKGDPLTTLVTVVVDSADAPQIGAYASAGDLVIAELSGER